MKTRKQYMNKEVSHHDYFSQFVTNETKRFVLRELSANQIIKALQSGDKHLNNIEIPFNNIGNSGDWWWDLSPVNVQLIREAGESLSRSTRTYVGKAAARMIAEEYQSI